MTSTRDATSGPVTVSPEPDDKTRDPSRAAAIRGEVRRKGFQRVSHGLYLPLADPSGGADAQRHRELEAWLLVLPEGTAFTHLTGAELRGWQLPKLPDDIPVFAAGRGKKRPRRPGLIYARLKHPSEPDIRSGLPVDSTEEILLRCSQEVSVLDLVILIDSAFRCKDLDRGRIEALLSSRRPGVRRLREAYRLSNAKSGSAGESVLGVFLEVCDIPVEPQKKLYDGQGRLIAQVDYWLVGTDFVSEYDGEHHRRKQQQRVDLRRDRLFNGSTYTRNGYTLDDLLNHPTATLHELIDRELLLRGL